MQIDEELTKKLISGVEMINYQHQMIFNYTNNLFVHCIGDDNEENDYFGKTIEIALELLTSHFKTEEDLMFATAYSTYDLLEHKKEHETFAASVAEYNKQFQLTGRVDLLSFASFAKWWVVGHIRRFDKRYVAYFNEITEGKGIERMKVT